MRKLSLPISVSLVLVTLPVLVLLVLSFLPNRWLTEKFEHALFKRLGVETSINTIDLNLFSFSPQVHGKDLSLRFPKSGLAISGLGFTANYRPLDLLTGNTHPKTLALRADQGKISVQNGIDGAELTHDYSLDADVLNPGSSVRELLVKDFTLETSDLRGNLQIDISTSPPTLTGEFESSSLDIDTLYRIHAALNRQVSDHEDKSAPAKRFFSPHPLNLDPLVSYVSGTVRYQALAARFRNLDMKEVALTFSANGETSLLSIDSDDFVDGKLGVIAALSLVSGQPRLQLETEVRHLSIGELFSVLGDENTADGKVSGKGKYWFSGRSAASLAASANGGMFLLIDQGELDSMFIELAGMDVTESLSLLFKRSIKSATVNCGYIDIKTKNGVSTLADFVMDTEDTVFTGSGTVNFNSQNIDLTIKPLPRDAGFLAAPTAIKIGGTLLEPKFRPAKTLLTRLATAAALATFASPAAIVVPFIEIGNDASGEGCASYVKTVE